MVEDICVVVVVVVGVERVVMEELREEVHLIPRFSDKQRGRVCHCGIRYSVCEIQDSK